MHVQNITKLNTNHQMVIDMNQGNGRKKLTAKVSENRNPFFQYYYSNPGHFAVPSVTKKSSNSNPTQTVKQLLFSIYMLHLLYPIPPKA